MRLSGRHAVVTGAGSGIGAAIARALSGEGGRVTLVGRDRTALDKVAAGLPSSSVAIADVTDREQVDAAFAEARAAQGPIAILVNNAGLAESAPFAKITPALWRRTMAVNLDALLHCCQAALPDLLATGEGRIVTIASTAARKGYAYAVAYTAAKHGALGLMRGLAAELAGTGVTANAVCPGFTDTPMLERSLATIAATTGRSPEEARATLAAFNPQGRIIAPEEVAAAVLWLCLPESGAVTGQAIAIAGGEIV
jgi:NAD(P)-dependent dehydrogenase (short-subunit alcohol dehydrogenase family)